MCVSELQCVHSSSGVVDFPLTLDVMHVLYVCTVMYVCVPLSDNGWLEDT
jgi:hypothetical protein